jgi:hypothetical protein
LDFSWYFNEVCVNNPKSSVSAAAELHIQTWWRDHVLTLRGVRLVCWLLTATIHRFVSQAYFIFSFS